MIALVLSDKEAAEVREAILETRLDWSPTLDRVTKEILDLLTERQRGQHD